MEALSPASRGANTNIFPPSPMAVKVDRSLLQMTGLSLVIALGITAHQAVTQADSHEDLVGIRITPAESTVNPGESVRLTAEGDYATMFARIRADWSMLEGEDLGSLGSCTNAKICTFEAGQDGGTVTIQAEVDSHSASATITINEASPFTDELPGWASEAILRLEDLGIVQGYEDGRFAAGDPVTRGQVVTLLFRLLGHTGLIEEPAPDTCDYTDLPQDHYAYIPVCAFRQHGWASTATEFNPDDGASRGMTAAFVNRVFGVTLLDAMGIAIDEAIPAGTVVFDDIPLDHPFYTDTAVMNATGIMTGYPNGDFGSDDQLNRAQGAVVMERVLSRIEEYGITALLGGDDEEVVSTPHGACTVANYNRNPFHSGAHAATFSPTGENYALHQIYAPVGGITELRAYCTDAIYEELMDQYCARPAHRSTQIEQGVIGYNEAGEVHTGGGRSAGSGLVSCPQEEETRVPHGACIVASYDSNPFWSGAPAATFEPVGDNHAMLQIYDNLTGVDQFSAYCTPAIHAQLVEQYCAYGTNRTRRFEKGYVGYNANGEVHMGGASGGLENCPAAASSSAASSVGSNGVDLQASNVSVEASTLNSPIVVHYNVTNVGGASMTQGNAGRLFIDVGNDGSWNVGVGGGSIAAPLAAGGQRSITTTFTPNTTVGNAHHVPVGTHRAQICVNQSGYVDSWAIQDTNSSNDCAEGTFTVSGS